MKPIKLYMRNFKSYGENAPELDFSNFDVILLTGDNGNGKSSLADAVAWALWGQCKGASQRSGMDDLVRLGSSEMEVCFTFEEVGSIYKVIRKRDKLRGQSSLDLLLLGENNRFVPISGSTKTETQSKIEKIIKLDYDTYLCTAYLSQGKADIFALKPPNERKQILCEILNLYIYDRLEKKAQEKRKEAEYNTKVIEREIESLFMVISENKDIDERLDDVIKKIEKIETEKKNLSENLEKLNLTLQEMEFSKKREQSCREDLIKAQREKDKLDKNFKVLSERIKSYEQLLKDETVITQRYKRLQHLRSENDLLNNKHRQISDLEIKIIKTEQGIKTKENFIKNEIMLIEQEMKQYQAKVNKKAELLIKEANLIEELKKLDEIECRSSKLEETLNAETKTLTMLSASLNALDEKRSENHEKIQKLVKAESICPVCSNLLDSIHKEELINEAQATGITLDKEIAKVKFEIKAAEEKIMALDKNIKDTKAQLKKRVSAEGQLRAASDGINDAELSKAEIEKLNKKAEQKLFSLTSLEYCANEQLELNRLNEAAKEIHYNPDIHKQVENELKAFASAQEWWIEMQKAKAALSSDVETKEHIIEMINQKNKIVEDINAQLIELVVKTKEMQVITEQIKSAQSDRMKIESNAKDLETKRGMLIECLNTMKRAQNEIAVKQKELVNTKKMITVYKTLAEIYGKGGIQAAIIENAIPELEVKTNEILGRITDGRLFVEFLTQRDKKSGGTIETLDIKISDESGTRKYETYSGGEEFRINFAIRIALSKVLAQRAGASLRMLILDEGFGVLDEQGREKLVEAINSIRDEFDNILVITHIQDLKEAFPLRLEVTKATNGSTFEMIG